MGRFTIKKSFGVYKPDEETIALCVDGYTQIVEQVCLSYDKPHYFLVGEAIDKLAAYEDLEERCISKCGCGLNMVIQKYKEFLDNMHELAEYWSMEDQGLLLKLECRCKDCVHVDCVGCSGTTVYCMKHEAYMNEDDFCIHAEKTKGEEHE